MIEQGRDTTANQEIALELFRLAANQGHAKAQVNLAAKYYHGEGVKEDIVMAYAWFTVAASLGNEHAALNVAIIGQDMNESQFERAQTLSETLLDKIPASEDCAASAYCPITE